MEINGEIVSENVRYADLGLSEPIMKALEKKGYEVVPVSELIYSGDYTVDDQGIQHKS